MKKIIAFLMTFFILLTNVPTAVFAGATDVRAAWIATVYNIDFPSVKNDSAAQKAEFSQKLDSLKSMGINTVFVQVRPKGDALYSSSINPWSDVLTGTQGKYPGYDPLEYMVSEAHSRGMKIHAWLNPYRVTTSGTDVSVLAENNPARLHPDWLINDGKKLTFDPSNDNVKQLICNTVKEIVSNYDVDGIHFDDYFYPSGYALRNGETAESRINNVSETIKMVYNTVHSTKSNVEFGVSPMGICVSTDTFKGGQSVNTVYADPRQWISGGYVDYIIPQVYWQTNHSTAPYESVIKWWNDLVQGTGVKLYIGEGIYKEAVASQITSHFDIDKKYSNISGNAFYSAKYLLNNTSGCSDAIKNYYASASNGNTSNNTNNSVANDSKADNSSSSNNTNNNASNSNTPNNNTTPSQPSVKPEQTPAKTYTAVSTSSAVLVDGNEKAFEAYNIDGYNYFKLRDIAYALNGSTKQFEVNWDESKNAINLKTGNSYTAAGGELTAGNGKNKTALSSTAELYINGNKVSAQAYNIDGMNYYKLRDVAKAVNFAVVWSENLNSIGIVSLFGYED